MIPAPISPNQSILPTAEADANLADDQVFSSGEAEGENLFEDMLALLSLLGTPSEAATTPVGDTESVVSTEAAVGSAEGMVATQSVANESFVSEAVAQNALMQASSGDTELNSNAETALSVATSKLGNEYLPTVAESTQTVEAQNVPTGVVDSTLATPTTPMADLSNTQPQPNDKQVAPTVSQSLQQPQGLAATETENVIPEEQLLTEETIEEELPEIKPVEASKQETSSHSQSSSSTPTVDLPIENDIVSAIEHRVSEATNSQESNTPTSSANTSPPPIAASSVSRTMAPTLPEIAEPIKVPIAEQVATHLATARIVRGVDKQEVTITLDPPRLGTISVEIIENNDVLAARVTAVEPVALQALQSNLSSLIESLEQAGIEFDSFEFGQQNQQQEQQHQRFDEGHPNQIRQPYGYSSESQTETETPPSRPETNQRLDITV